MNIWIIIGVSILIFFIVFIKILSKPIKFKKKLNDVDLKPAILALYNRGFDGGVLTLWIPKRKEFLQFSKYIGRKNAGIQMDYPLAEWSKSYYDSLKKILNENNIDFDIETTKTKSVPQFIVVDFKDDLEKVFDTIILIMDRLYGLSIDNEIIITIENISPIEEKIGVK